MPNVNVTDAEAEFARLLFPSLRTLGPRLPLPACPGIRPTQLIYPGASGPGFSIPTLVCKGPGCPGVTLPPPPPCVQQQSPMNLDLQKETVATATSQNSKGWQSTATVMRTEEDSDCCPGMSCSDGGQTGKGVSCADWDYTSPTTKASPSCVAPDDPPSPTPAPSVCSCQGGNRQNLLSIIDQSVTQGISKAVAEKESRSKPEARIVAKFDQRLQGQNGATIDVVGFIGITGR